MKVTLVMVFIGFSGLEDRDLEPFFLWCEGSLVQDLAQQCTGWSTGTSK